MQYRCNALPSELSSQLGAGQPCPEENLCSFMPYSKPFFDQQDGWILQPSVQPNATLKVLRNRVSSFIQVCDIKGHGQFSYTNENAF